MNRLLILYFLSVFFISCNKDIHFFSTGEPADDSFFTIERSSLEISEIKKKKRGRSRRRRRRRRSRFVYQQPPKEESIVLDGQVDFIQLAATNIQSLNLQKTQGTAISITTNADNDKEKNVVQQWEVKPVSSVEIAVPAPSSYTSEEVNTEQTEQSQEEEKQGMEIYSPVVQEERLEAPHFSPLELNPEVSKPVEVFIPRPLDMVFVIDTSTSMHQHLVGFKKKFAYFLEYFSNLDWKLALTNADHGETGFFLFDLGALEGRFMDLERQGETLDLQYLHSGIFDYNRIFLDSISQHRIGEYRKFGNEGYEDIKPCDLPPSCQSYKEQPLKVLKSSLSKNEDFFRKEADLVAVVISNSAERAVDEAAMATQPQEVIEAFKNIHGWEKRFEVYGVIITEGDENCLNQNINNQFFFPEGAFSRKIASLSEMTGGKVFSICSSDYRNLARGIFNSFGKPQ